MTSIEYSLVTNAWAPPKKINAEVELESIFQTRGNPIQIVANRRGRSDQIDFLLEGTAVRVVVILPLASLPELRDP